MSDDPPQVGVLAGGRTRKYHRLVRDEAGRLTVACDHDKPDAAERVERWDLDMAETWREPCQQPHCFGDCRSVRLAFRRGEVSRCD